MAESTGQGLMELADLISRREYNWGLVRGRVYEEELVHSYADENNIEYTTLADTIEELYRNGIISDSSRENLHGLRILGNKAVHEGNNDPQDAKKAYYMLKDELQAFSNRNAINPERTPVMINSRDEANNSNEGEVYIRRTRRNQNENNEASEDIDMGYARNGRRSSRTATNQGRRKRRTSSGINLYTVLKILIPVLIIVLLIILIKSLIPPKEKPAETTDNISTEAPVAETEETPTPEMTTAAPTTAAPTTEALVSYQISGDGVNIRYASDPSQIYTQLSKGTFIGQVEDFTGNSEYSDFAKFTYDGKEVIVSKRYIEKVTN